MPVQLNFETSVDAAAFMAFRDAFKKYLAELEKTPALWKDTGHAFETFGKSLAGASRALDKQAANMADITKHTGTLHQLTTSTSRMWHTMSRSTRDVAGHIKSATEQLLKWAGLTTLIGAGTGAFGMYRLGESVSAGRISSMGRGMSLGGMRAVQTNYARFGDPNQLLDAIARAKFDPTDPARPGLLALGVDLNADTDVAFQQAERGFKRLADTTSPQLYTNVLEAMGLGGATNYEHLENLRRGTTPEDLRGIERKTAEDKRKMDLTPDEQRRWQDFMIQLERAGKQIETIFVVGLASHPRAKGSERSFREVHRNAARKGRPGQ